MEKIAIIIRGPSGAGKSSVAHLLHQKIPHSAHIDIDLIKRMISEESSAERTSIAHATTLAFIQALATHEHIIILEEIFRDTYFYPVKNLLEKLGYRCLTVFLTAPLPHLLKRDAERTIKIKGEQVISRLSMEIVPHEGEMVIDTSALQPEETAEKIRSAVSL